MQEIWLEEAKKQFPWIESWNEDTRGDSMPSSAILHAPKCINSQNRRACVHASFSPRPSHFSLPIANINCNAPTRKSTHWIFPEQTHRQTTRAPTWCLRYAPESLHRYCHFVEYYRIYRPFERLGLNKDKHVRTKSTLTIAYGHRVQTVMHSLLQHITWNLYRV